MGVVVSNLEELLDGYEEDRVSARLRCGEEVHCGQQQDEVEVEVGRDAIVGAGLYATSRMLLLSQ